MTEAVKAQYRAAGLPIPNERTPKRAPGAPVVAPTTAGTGEAARSQQARKEPLNPAITSQRLTPPEPPGPKPSAPVRWQVADGGLYAEQFPGCFRVVVTGPTHRLPEVLAALEQLMK